MDNNRFPFSEKTISKIPYSEPGITTIYYDTNIAGLGLRVSAKSKTFFLYRRVKGGVPVRITLGQYGVINYELAKKGVAKESVVLNEGINPLFERKEKLRIEKAIKLEEDKLNDKNNIETVEKVFDYYIKEKIKGGKDNGGRPSTLKDMQLMKNYFSRKEITKLKYDDKKQTWVKDIEIVLPDLLKKPFRDLKPLEVLNRFKDLELACPARIPKGKPLEPIKRSHQLTFKYANSAFTFYNRIHKLTNLIQGEVLQNPFEIITVSGKWRKTETRKRFIDFEKIDGYKWWTAVNNYNVRSVADYFLFSLVQAGRSIEISSLKWNTVNIENKEITYLDTKNGKKYVFPLTKLAIEILERRKKDSEGTEYIFEYPSSKKHHVPQDCQNHFKAIGKISGINITHHDLRRTWATQARRLKVIDDRMSDYCLKHTRNDVGENYYVDMKNEISAGLQLVENSFLSQVKAYTENVLPKKELNES